jgi:hypothetical protein
MSADQLQKLEERAIKQSESVDTLAKKLNESATALRVLEESYRSHRWLRLIEPFTAVLTLAATVVIAWVTYGLSVEANKIQESVRQLTDSTSIKSDIDLVYKDLDQVALETPQDEAGHQRRLQFWSKIKLKRQALSEIDPDAYCKAMEYIVPIMHKLALNDLREFWRARSRCEECEPATRLKRIKLGKHYLDRVASDSKTYGEDRLQMDSEIQGIERDPKATAEQKAEAVKIRKDLPKLPDDQKKSNGSAQSANGLNPVTVPSPNALPGSNPNRPTTVAIP